MNIKRHDGEKLDVIVDDDVDATGGGGVGVIVSKHCDVECWGG